MKKNPYKGKFIVFEGIDGCGKTTQLKLLSRYLGNNILVTKEPTDNKIGKFIKKALNKNWQADPISLQLLFSADRAEHLKNEIVPAVKSGKTVLCDRYFFSTIAFGMLEIKDFEWLRNLGKHFPIPDITFLFNVSPEACLDRIKKSRSKRTLFEENKKLKNIWKSYQALSKKYKNIYIINGERSKKEVFGDVKKVIDKKLK